MATTLEPLAPFDGEDIWPLDDAKLWLRVDGADEDDLIASLRDAALDWVERYTAKGLSQRDWRWTTSAFADPLRVSFGPIVAVGAVRYQDMSGDVRPLNSDNYRIAGAAIAPAVGVSWPITAAGDGAVSVDFTAGFEAVAAEAPALLTAVKLLLKQLYDDRGASEPSAAVFALCAPFRTPVIG